MSFDVRRADVDAVGVWVAGYCSAVCGQLSLVAAAALRVSALEGFRGAAADGVKAYWGEAHALAAQTLALALQELAARYAEYADELGSVDGARDARFSSDALQAVRAHLPSSADDLASKASRLDGALSGVSDLVGSRAPSPSALSSSLLDLGDRARDALDRVRACEDRHASAASQVDALLDAARRMVSSLGSGGGAARYVPGSVASEPWAAQLASALEASAAYSAGRADAAAASFEGMAGRMRERWEEELARAAREREDRGWAQIVLGGLSVAVGIVAIVATEGAATPFVAPMMSFGASEMVEGMQNAWYGHHGDPCSLAFNPLRDTVFLGNQDLYDVASFGAELVGSFGMPLSAAAGAVRAAGVPVLKALPRAGRAFAGEAVRDLAFDAAADAALSLAADPFVDRLFGPTAAGAAAKEALRGAAGMAGALRGGAGLGGSLRGGAGGRGPAAGGPKPFLADGSHLSGGALRPDVRYSCGEHGYVYETDSLGRIERVEVESLSFKTHDGRLSHDPNTPGKLEGDHAGHLIADRFGGSPELDNLVSQAQRVNQSAYAKLENIWAKALGEGKEVSVDIKVVYDGDGTRPVSFEVDYWIDGKKFNEIVENS